MKIAKIFQPASSRLKKMVAERRGWNLKKSKGFEHLKEDYYLQSKKFPIFAMADGILLAIKPGSPYPVPSGAGEVAEMFCRSAVKYSEKIYYDFHKSNIADVFSISNAETEKYNKKRGRTKKTVNYFDTDYFGATAAFVLVKNSELFWGAVGDTKILLVNRNGKVKVASSDQVEPIERLAAKKFPHPKPQEKKIFQQRYYRNKIGKNGKLIGYGVIDGEPEALQYIESGRIKVKKGDRLFIFTDGFTPYFKLSEFKKLFHKWPAILERKVTSFVQEYIAGNLPRNAEKQYRFLYKYASEKSLFAVKF